MVEAAESESKHESQSEKVAAIRPEVTKLRKRAADLTTSIGKLYEETPKPEFGPAPDPQILKDLERNCGDSAYY